MKKVYISPLMMHEQAEASQMLASSGVTGGGMGYGGVDNSGDKEPSVKEFLWDDSEE